MDADIDALPKGSVTTGRLRWNLRRVPRHGSHSEQEWDLEQEWEVATSTGTVKVWRPVPSALDSEL